MCSRKGRGLTVLDTATTASRRLISCNLSRMDSVVDDSSTTRRSVSQRRRKGTTTPQHEILPMYACIDLGGRCCDSLMRRRGDSFSSHFVSIASNRPSIPQEAKRRRSCLSILDMMTAAASSVSLVSGLGQFLYGMYFVSGRGA